tara:strand:- start:531 stop:1001 length:471 start_codon:yes stop_codon:yes gene_type:complete
VSDLIKSDNPFTEDELAAMRRVAGLMIPASEEFGVPGADDDAIFAAVALRCAEASDVLKAGIAAMESMAGERHDARYVELAADDAGKLAVDLQGARESFMRLLMSNIAQCYYLDDRVLEALDIEPRPPFPEGHEVEQGDWSLLDPVRSRDKFYRPV